MGLFLDLNLFLDVLYESLSWLERGDVVRWDEESGVLGDVPARFLGTLFNDKTTKSAQVHVLTCLQAIANLFHKGFYSCLNVSFVHTRFIGYSGNDVSLSHEILISR